MTISALVVTLVVTMLIPAAVSLLTKSTASVWLKQFLNALLSTATAVIVVATLPDGTAHVTGSAVVLAIGGFIASQAAYVGLYKPHDVNEVLAPGVGLG